MLPILGIIQAAAPTFVKMIARKAGMQEQDVKDFVGVAKSLTKDDMTELEVELAKDKIDLEKKQIELQKEEVDLSKQQVEVNKIDAKSDDKFQSRWRPFMGWIGGISLGLYFIVFPVIMFTKNLILDRPPPEYNAVELFGLVTTILGGVTYRTLEKKAKMKLGLKF